MFLMIRFQLTRHCTSSPYSPFSDKSFLILSNHFRLGLPLRLFPDTSITTTLAHIGPMYSSSLLNSLVKLHSSIFNTLISATYCDFFTAHVSAAYTIAGVTIVLYTFPLTLKHIIRSHRTPDSLFQLFPSRLYCMRHLRIQASILCKCRS